MTNNRTLLWQTIEMWQAEFEPAENLSLNFGE